MQIEIASITTRRQRWKSAPAQLLFEEFVQRASRYEQVQAVVYSSEQTLVAAFERSSARTSASLILLDSRGEALTSAAIASRLRRFRDGGAQQLTFAIGPADGWSPQLWSKTSHALSLGAITLPHELALVVLAEQLYRAFTILAGHPYHSGHE